MSESGTFPDALRSTAVARWSHRDPIECGNPFSPEDARYSLWHAATTHAKDTLIQNDAELELKQARHPQPYSVRLIALAAARFDIWAQRTLAVVEGPRAFEDYSRWLDDYRENWLTYVAETCPNIDVVDDLRAKLVAQSRLKIDETG
jgi:hypothetical protein